MGEDRTLTSDGPIDEGGERADLDAPEASGEAANEVDDDHSVDTAPVELGDLEPLIRLFETLAVAERVDNECQRLQTSGVLSFYVPGGAQNAVSAAVGCTLEEGDWAYPSYRDLAMYLARGGAPRALFDQLLANGRDPAAGRQLPGHFSLPGGRYISVSGALGTQIPQAVGTGIAMQLRGNYSVTLVSFGAAAVAQSGFHQGMELAARFRPPVIMICSVAARAGLQGSLEGRAGGYGVASRTVDGGDPVAMLEACGEARQTVRDSGAMLLIAELPDPALSAAKNNGGLAARRAVETQLEELVAGGPRAPLLSERLAAILSTATDTVREASASAAESAPPAASRALEDIYGEPSWMQQEQSEWLA